MVEVALYEAGADEDAEPLDSYTIQLEPTRTGYRMTTRGATHDLRILQTRIAHLADRT